MAAARVVWLILLLGYINELNLFRPILYKADNNFPPNSYKIETCQPFNILKIVSNADIWH